MSSLGVRGSPRILLVLTSLARSSGGGRTFASGLSRALADSDKVRLSVVLPRGADEAVANLPAAVKRYYVEPRVGLARIARDMTSLSQWVEIDDPDLVVVPHEWGAPTRGVPLVNVVQNVLYLHPVGSRESRVRWVLMRQAARRTTRFVTGTFALSPSAAALWQTHTGSTSRVLPAGVDEMFVGSAAQQADDLLVLMTGDAAYRNPTLALQTVAALRQRGLTSRVVVVGLQRPSAWDHDTEFLSSVSSPELAALFRRARVVALSSGLESFGFPAFEAVAAGATVVVGSETPMAEWLGAYPSVVTTTLDAPRFAGAISSAMADEERVRRPVGGLTWGDVGPRWVDALLDFCRAPAAESRAASP